jgi:hypothetical protein
MPSQTASKAEKKGEDVSDDSESDDAGTDEEDTSHNSGFGGFGYGFNVNKI